MKPREDFDYDRILKTLLKHGGEYAELYSEETRSISILYEDNKIEKVISGIDRGVGLRLIKDLRTAYAFSNDVSSHSLVSLAEELASSFPQKAPTGSEAVTINALDPAFSLPVKIDPIKIDTGKKIEAVSEANDAARTEKNIRQVRVIYRDSKKDVFIANWDGHSGTTSSEARTGSVFVVHVVAVSGDIMQTGYEPIGGTVGFELFDDRSPAQVAKAAADRANLMLSADRAPGGLMMVVLDASAGGTMIHEAVGHGLEADLAQRKLSVYADKIGEKVASEIITVIDDSTIPQKRGSFVFDDEGTPSQKTILIERGILKKYMHDTLSSLRGNTQSTGNGRRESYRHKPIPRMTNTLIAPGKMNPADIIASVDRGILVKKMGGGQVNTINGQFVFEVSEGYLIEKGTVTKPVRGAILTGSGPEVLMEIDMVGNDLGYAIGTCGKDGQGVPVGDAQPTLRIPAITVGGTV
jgi:TldD protein